MKTKLIRIGNSKGIRIPKPVIDQAELSDEVELIVGDNEIILRSVSNVRRGWENAFRKMSKSEDDTLIDINTPDVTNDFDETEWEW